MTAKLFGTCTRFLFAACACLLLLLNGPNVPPRTHAQNNKVTLVSEETEAIKLSYFGGEDYVELAGQLAKAALPAT